MHHGLFVCIEMNVPVDPSPLGSPQQGWGTGEGIFSIRTRLHFFRASVKPQPTELSTCTRPYFGTPAGRYCGRPAFASRLTRDRRVPCTMPHVPCFNSVDAWFQYTIAVFVDYRGRPRLRSRVAVCPFLSPLSRTRALSSSWQEAVVPFRLSSVAFAVPSATYVDAQWTRGACQLSTDTRGNGPNHA